MSTILMRVRVATQELVLRAVRRILGPTGVVRGCLFCRAFMDIEEWANPRDLRARLCDDGKGLPGNFGFGII